MPGTLTWSLPRRAFGHPGERSVRVTLNRILWIMQLPWYRFSLKNTFVVHVLSAFPVIQGTQKYCPEIPILHPDPAVSRKLGITFPPMVPYLCQQKTGLLLELPRCKVTLCQGFVQVQHFQ